MVYGKIQLFYRARKEMSDYLIRYIETYDYFVYSTQGIAAFIFGFATWFLVKTYGITERSNVQKLPGSWLLIVCLLFCVVTSVSNFTMRGSIATFYSDAYKFEMTKKSEICKTDEEEYNLEKPSHFFHYCVRENSLRFLARLSFISCLIAFISIIAWFLLQRKRTARMNESA